MFLKKYVGGAADCAIELDGHVVEIAGQIGRSKPVILCNRTQLDNLDLIIIIFRNNLDNSPTSLSTLLTIILILLGPADHKTVIMLEHTRIIKLNRDDEVHLCDRNCDSWFQ